MRDVRLGLVTPLQQDQNRAESRRWTRVD